MNRLIKRDQYGRYIMISNKEVCDKLYALEDIEEELGIDLINLFKALKNGADKIIKLPKEPKKKKLRDLTNDEYTKWKIKNCVSVNRNCTNCMFRNANCSGTNLGWVNNKEVYSDTFLDQEIEVED